MILKQESFSLLKPGQNFGHANFVKLTGDGPRCLEQIIMVQRDEPDQKYCIYRVSNIEKAQTQSYTKQL